MKYLHRSEKYKVHVMGLNMRRLTLCSDNPEEMTECDGPVTCDPCRKSLIDLSLADVAPEVVD
jgi:hypothetical protein